MHETKSLWRVARARATRCLGDWVSASRDSEAATSQFSHWLASLRVAPESLSYFITGPHTITVTTWCEGVGKILTCFPESNEVYLLADDLRSVLTLSSLGIARFTSAKDQD
jgi:hypothetical protein